MVHTFLFVKKKNFYIQSKRKKKKNIYMSVFLSNQAPENSPNLLRDLQAICPNVLMVMHRSKNKNVVVVAANIENGVLNTDFPVDVFWLDLEPSFIQARRAQGIAHDREELSYFERKFAWGVDAHVIDGTRAQFQFAAEPTQSFDIVVQKGVPRLFTTWRDQKYMIRSAFVDATDKLRINMRDNVRELSLNCINLATKKPETVFIVGGPDAQ